MKALKRIGFITAAVIIVLFFIIIIILSIGPVMYSARSTQEKWDDKQREIEKLRDTYEENDKESGTDYGKDESSGILFTGDDESLDKKEEPVKRMKVYFGFLRLRVDNVKETRSSISALADEMGGYVESSYENTIIIRVPRELFTEILGLLMEMGEVLNKSIETYDVTDIFRDLAARLAISQKTRDRLYKLLDKTKDVTERLKILKEIRRLSEEIERISMTLKNIQQLISYSRITIQLEQRLTDLSYEDKRSIPFPWIASLDPFYVSLTRLRGKVKLKTGDEFAVFDNKKYFFAESTGGVRIRVATTKNTPHGDTGFWQKGVEYHLARFYKETRFLELGSFKAVLFKSKDARPFYYIAGVAVKGERIFVCEVLFPDQAAFEALGDVVTTYIKGCTIR